MHTHTHALSVPNPSDLLYPAARTRYEVTEFFRYNALGGNTRHNVPFLFGGPLERPAGNAHRLWLPQLMQRLGYVNAAASDHFKATAVARVIEPFMQHVLAFREMFAPSKFFKNEVAPDPCQCCCVVWGVGGAGAIRQAGVGWEEGPNAPFQP